MNDFEQGHAWYRVTRFESEQNGTPNVVARYDVWADSPSHAVEKLHVATQKAREAEGRRYLPMWNVRCAYKLKSQGEPIDFTECPYGYRFVGLKYA